nr:4'-phosphopantetheinyl transferase superfamily protein [Corynebacterium lactis]
MPAFDVDAFRRLLPGGVSFAGHQGALATTPPLIGDEALAAARFSEARRREFAVGRQVARQALAGLGRAGEQSIGVGRGRQPLWPDGVVGSLTHTGDVAAAAVADVRALRGIGIDIERDQELAAGVAEAVLRPDEPRVDPVVQFSAKESLYKLWWPIARQWLDFGEVAVDVGADGALRYRIDRAVPPEFRRLRAAWLRSGDFVATAAWIETD